MLAARVLCSMGTVLPRFSCWTPFILVFGCSDKQPAFPQPLLEGLIAPEFTQPLWEAQFPLSLWERYNLTNHARGVGQMQRWVK